MYGKTELDSVFEITELYTAFHNKYESTYSFAGEYHDFWEIVLVLDGNVGITADKTIMTLNKGHAILHEPMEFHRIWSEGTSSPEIVIFSFSCKNMPYLKSRLFKINEFNAKEAISLINSIERTFLTDSVSVKGIYEPKSLEYQIVTKKLELFILNVLSRNITEVKKSTSQSAKNYAQIMQILENNIDKNLTISEIAKMCSMSEINLKKTFNKYAGTGIKSYFNGLKMNEAISMLSSGKTVTETASALGFADQNYFSAAFKRIIGKPPSDFRN